MDTALLVTLAALSGADLAMTSDCLARHVCCEANPMLRPLAEKPALLGAVKMGITAGAVAGIWKATKGRPRARTWALVGIVGLQAVVVGVNYAHLH